jgi:hypothetical protein
VRLLVNQTYITGHKVTVRRTVSNVIRYMTVPREYGGISWDKNSVEEQPTRG